jgi:hypothetical protein
MYEPCDRCGVNCLILNKHRKNIDTIHMLCNDCYAELIRQEDRLAILEGWVEAIGNLTQSVIIPRGR